MREKEDYLFCEYRYYCEEYDDKEKDYQKVDDYYSKPIANPRPVEHIEEWCEKDIQEKCEEQHYENISDTVDEEKHNQKRCKYCQFSCKYPIFLC